ncbi:MAG: 23S rRNA (adenine(2503)-C(2))-methyltransferase RlmN [Deltaproteobacteria bacterium]|nr:23S rRNA (adenine(2503)-C(2))-methyltransferase RlmN [Deltaproteobacteria bacterium]
MQRSALAMTLAEYAAARSTHPQALRSEYVQLFRDSTAAPLAPVTRCEEHEGVVKFCLDVGSGLETESVIIPMDSYRGSKWHTLCVSTQVGCRMGCTFCETGRMGLMRNLTIEEIVTQRIVARRLRHQRTSLPTRPYSYFRDGIRNVVFMGMGEPFDNFDNLVGAIRVLNEPNGLAIPLTQMTVSTVGRIDGLQQLADIVRREPSWANLRIALSLNASNDAVRTQIMPINKSAPLAELQRALLDYPLARRGLYLIEYVMLAGVNDSVEDADAVADWCRPLRCVVNLIPYNPQRDAAYATSDDATVFRFLRRLRSHGIFVKRRVTQGRNLMGACGQLGNPELRRPRRTNRAAGEPVDSNPA